MRLIIQRVSSAKVRNVVKDQIVGDIGRGLFVLLAVKKGDTQENALALAEKLSKIRLMSDEKEKMNLSVDQVGGSFLVVSQFTLYANTRDGNRPSFVDSEEPEKARKLYEIFVDKLRQLGARVEMGSFGEYMSIDAQLDGPVTVILEN